MGVERQMMLLMLATHRVQQLTLYSSQAPSRSPFLQQLWWSQLRDPQMKLRPTVLLAPTPPSRDMGAMCGGVEVTADESLMP